ncbi:MAG: endonuclease domain-containing protein [Vicingaceae bacterium]
MTKKSHYNKELKPLARNLRNDSTLGEILLWDNALKQKRCLGYQFVRQFSIGKYILDFACRKLKIAIEIDGYSHNFSFNKDQEKDNFLQGIGYTVLRFEEQEVRKDINNVIRTIEGTIKELETK